MKLKVKGKGEDFSQLHICKKSLEFCCVYNANENGFSMIRVLQDDVYFNRFDWLQEIKNSIEKITTEQKIQNIYICKKNEYDNFELGLE